jgi:hypothetical protein
VTPYLRSSDGAEMALPPVQIGADEVVTIDLHDVIPVAAPRMKGAYGSVAFRYQAPLPRALYAAVTKWKYWQQLWRDQHNAALGRPDGQRTRLTRSNTSMVRHTRFLGLPCRTSSL